MIYQGSINKRKNGIHNQIRNNMQKAKIGIKIVVFTVSDNQLLVLLQDTKLLHGQLGQHNSLDDVAQNIFSQSTNISLKNNYIEQLYTFLEEKDDTQVSIVYYLLLPDHRYVLPQSLKWYNALAISKNCGEFDIISYAIRRLQWKVEYTNVVYSLLPEAFTLSELQEVYETILDKKLDKRNFRKKMLSLYFLKPTAQKRTAGSRPALLYRFKERKAHIIKVF